MNQETLLQVQAWVDGELSPAAAAQVAQQVAQDPALRALADELKTTQAALAGNELERQLQESREFFWSKIEKRIQALETEEAQSAEAASAPWLPRWLRFLAPAGVLAALALVMLGPVVSSRHAQLSGPQADVDSPLDDISSFTFRSEAEGMTVVWLTSK